MEQKVIISIEGKRFLPQSEPETTLSQALGTLEDLGQAGVVLTYQEGADTGLEGTLTTLRVEQGRVILERTGPLGSQMVFEEGREHRCVYKTPYGTLPMRIQTRKLSSRLSSQGGELSIDYDLELGGAGAGRNVLCIQVRPARETRETI